MRFPRLRSLTLGIWEFDTDRPADESTRFILAHSDTIEGLDLEYDPDSDCQCAIAFDNSSLALLQPDSLPHLRTFTGNTQGSMIMAQTGMRCLTTTLTRLKIGPGAVGSPSCGLNAKFNAVISSRAGGGLPAPKEIMLDIFQWRDRNRDNIVHTIRKCVECCGTSLEV